MMDTKHFIHNKLSNILLLLKENIWGKPLKPRNGIHQFLHNWDNLAYWEKTITLFYFYSGITFKALKASIAFKALNPNNPCMKSFPVPINWPKCELM